VIKFDDGFLHHTFTDTVLRSVCLPRLPAHTIRELQDAHNANLCDGNDETWFDGENDATDAQLTIIDEIEFFERYVD
jgi:hypothetical protein